MTVRGVVAILILVLIISIIGFGSYFLSTSTKRMEKILTENIELITNKQIKNAEDKFGDFLDEYEKDRLLLSVFISDTVTKNINMSIKKISKTFKDEFQEALLVEFEELLSNIKSIYNEYSLTIENIF